MIGPQMVDKSPSQISMNDESKPVVLSPIRLFVSNFPFKWDKEDLRNFFKDYAPVTDVDVVYNDRGSKGFGFVTIPDEQRCEAALLSLNKKVVESRVIEVRPAHLTRHVLQPASSSPQPYHPRKKLKPMKMMQPMPQNQIPMAPVMQGSPYPINYGDYPMGMLGFNPMMHQYVQPDLQQMAPFQNPYLPMTLQLVPSAFLNPLGQAAVMNLQQAACMMQPQLTQPPFFYMGQQPYQGWPMVPPANNSLEAPPR
ncbi:unnamed protein product, partial [Mesorhabditis spiculigera]